MIEIIKIFKIMVDINYNWKYVLAITIERRNTYVAICNLKSEVVKQEIIRTDYDLPAEEFVKVIAQKGKDILYESGMGKADILGVGVSLPGHVNWKTGVALHKYGVFDHDINIVSLLSKELDCPVAADNNVRAFAEGESLTIPHPETENFLYKASNIAKKYEYKHQKYDSYIHPIEITYLCWNHSSSLPNIFFAHSSTFLHDCIPSQRELVSS